MSGSRARSSCKDISYIVARCSYAIFLSREAKHWDYKRELLSVFPASENEEPQVENTQFKSGVADSDSELRSRAAALGVDQTGSLSQHDLPTSPGRLKEQVAASGISFDDLGLPIVQPFRSLSGNPRLCPSRDDLSELEDLMSL